MQTLNLQAPMTAEVQSSPKAKGGVPTKKTVYKRQPERAKQSSFKDMVDQSVKREEGASPKSAQSSSKAQEAAFQQQTATQNDVESSPDRTGNGSFESDAVCVSCDKGVGSEAPVAFVQASPVEVSWLQSAMQGQSTQDKVAQEQSAPALVEPLGEKEIAFLKADPLFDVGEEGILVPQDGANLPTDSFSSILDDDSSSFLTDGTQQRLAADPLKTGSEDDLTLKVDEANQLLWQSEGIEAALFEPQDAGGKQKDKAHISEVSLQKEALNPLGEMPLADSRAADIASTSGEAQTSPEVVAAQNELLGGVFTVTDLRAAPQKDGRAAGGSEGGKAQVGEGGSELTLELSLPQTTHSFEHTVLKQTDGVPSFQRLLSQQLRDGSPDFAKAGSIVLRGENEGTIKMTLRPESLGNVKINLELSDNVITGKIAVASKEAFEAFKQNIDAFRQAFSDSGFEGAEFTLSYFDSSSGFAQESGEQNDGHFLSSRAYADYVSGEGSLSDAGETQVFALDTDKRVNVVA